MISFKGRWRKVDGSYHENFGFLRTEVNVMRRVIDWIKQHSTVLIMTTVFALFPLICAMIWSLWNGRTIAQVYLPASYWNDELMYYKQVEAVVEHGWPIGYFGYNEAHAESLYFAAWNPVMLLPWCLWGFLFGWNLTAPVYANIFYTMLCMGGFYLLARPGKRQSAWILGMLAIFTPYTRYLLSGTPESLFMALTILFTGCAVAWIHKQSWGYLAAMFAITLFFSLSRPYLMLLMLLPLFFCIKRYKWKGAAISAGAFLSAAVGYVIIAKYATAPYIGSIINMDWLSLFVTDGIGAGFRYVYQTLYDKFNDLVYYFLVQGVSAGLFSGALYAVTGFLAILAAIWLGMLYVKKERADLRWLYWHYGISVIGMILALFLFYTQEQGARHLMNFIVLGLLLLGLAEKRALVMKLAVMAVCGYFFLFKALNPYDWQVPYDDGMIRQELEQLEIQVNAEMELQADNVDPYENTIIWLWLDTVDGENIHVPWGLIYAMPGGFAINFCTQEYVVDHIAELHSAYIVLLPGGEIERLVLEQGYRKIAETERIAVYERPNSAELSI